MEILSEVNTLLQAVRDQIRIVDGNLGALVDASGTVLPVCVAWARQHRGGEGAEAQAVRDDLDKVLELLFPHVRATAALFVRDHSFSGRAGSWLRAAGAGAATGGSLGGASGAVAGVAFAGVGALPLAATGLLAGTVIGAGAGLLSERRRVERGQILDRSRVDYLQALYALRDHLIQMAAHVRALPTSQQ